MRAALRVARVAGGGFGSALHGKAAQRGGALKDVVLSIVAEVVAVWHGRDGGGLSNAGARIHEVGA